MTVVSALPVFTVPRTVFIICFLLLVAFLYSGHSPGRAGGPASCGHSKLARVCTGLMLTSVQFIRVTEVRHEKA